MSETCRACGEPLVWAMTPAGAASPICAGRDRERGNVMLVNARGFGTMAITLSKGALAHARERDIPLHLNHFGNCAQADEFRASGLSDGREFILGAPTTVR